jgi:hypothetical protein
LSKIFFWQDRIKGDRWGWDYDWSRVDPYFEGKLTLLLHKDPAELTGCLYKEMVYTFLMILSKSYYWNDPVNCID